MAQSLRQKRKRIQSISLMKAALIELIMESEDAHAITVSEITDRADFNRSTFYFHYKDKAEIVEELYQDALSVCKKALALQFETNQEVSLKDIIPTTTLLFNSIADNKELFKALHALRTTPTIYDRLEQCYWQLFSDNEFELKPLGMPNMDYNLLLSSQIHALLGIIKYWIETDFCYSSEFMCEQMTMINLNRPSDMIIRAHTKNI